MKKLLLLSIVALYSAILTAQSIPDGGFENWNTLSWNDPTYYNTSNDQNVPLGIAANVTQTTGYLNVNYGVQIETTGITGNAISAFCINASVNGSVPTGGIPTGWTTKPTGIRFYYQYAPANNDTAVVLVMFKKSGVVVDSFLVILPVAENSYTLHSYYPRNPLPVVPDTVIVGASSTIQVLKNGGGGNEPAGSKLIIDSITFTGVNTQPAELNGDFQQWTTDTTHTPTGWYINYPNVTRTTDAASGNYALQVETENAGGGIQPGQAGTGYYSQNCHGNCNELGGYAYAVPASGIDTLEFAYKYAPAAGDTASINVDFVYKGHSVFGNSINLFRSNAVYKDTMLIFNFGNTQIDTAIININSSQHNNDTTSAQYAPYMGSTLKVDNLFFTSQKAADLGVNELSAKGEIKVYPNPANNLINIDLTNLSGALEQLAIYDMSGRMLSSVNYADATRNTIETINISNFSAGIYLIEATTSDGKFYQKVCKQ